MNFGAILMIASLAALVILMILLMAARMFRKVGPNEALIVFGFGGTKIVQGGGAIVLPMVQSCQVLSLELMSFDVSPEQDLYTEQGVAVTVEAVAQIKVKSDPESIKTAAEQLLSKTTSEREGLIRLVMQGHLRGIVGQLTVEQIVKEPDMVSGKMRSTCAEDLNKMGLEVVSFTIREVEDKNEYIVNMGRPDVARIKRDADVATAEAERDTAIRRAVAVREAAIATAQADQERVIAETASLAKQAEATRDMDLKKADYHTAVRKAQAQADKSYEIQTNIMEQQVIAEQVRVQRIEKEEQIKVQEAEILRRERELTATVLKAAEAERKRIEALAEGERQKLSLEAAGHADAIRSQGMAEAEVVKAKGQAEAEAMAVKAAAYLQYNQAAVLDKLLSNLPEVMRAMSEPLSKVDKITIVSTGNGHNGLGASQITDDMAKMMAQFPAIVETLSGIKMSQLMEKVPGLRLSVEEPLTKTIDHP
jgi:flotillin